MQRKHPFDCCERRVIPRRLRAEIMLRQDGRCADCGTRLIMGFFVFDHRPPLALREQADDPNDPERLAAICWICDQQKTSKDLKEIAGRSASPTSTRILSRASEKRCRDGACRRASSDWGSRGLWNGH